MIETTITVEEQSDCIVVTAYQPDPRVLNLKEVRRSKELAELFEGRLRELESTLGKPLVFRGPADYWATAGH